MRIERPVRDQVTAITCTMDEKEDMFRKARDHGMTVSAYIRWLVKQTEEKKDE